MRTESAETEVRQRVGGFLLFKPAGVFPGAEAEHIRTRPPLRAVYGARSGGDLDVDAPAFPRTPRRGTEQRRQTRLAFLSVFRPRLAPTLLLVDRWRFEGV